jgi:excinuclease ABC subunit C
VSDDLRALAEVLNRRLNHREWQYPNLFVIDGGKPQLDFIKKVFIERKINIPFLGISKFQNDKLVIPKNFSKNLKELVQINKRLLLQVRDEAHRFANNFSRRKRLIHRG